MDKPKRPLRKRASWESSESILQARVAALQTELQKNPSKKPENKTLEHIEEKLKYFSAKVEQMTNDFEKKVGPVHLKFEEFYKKHPKIASYRCGRLGKIRMGVKEVWGEIEREEVRLQNALLSEAYGSGSLVGYYRQDIYDMRSYYFYLLERIDCAR